MRRTKRKYQTEEEEVEETLDSKEEHKRQEGHERHFSYFNAPFERRDRKQNLWHSPNRLKDNQAI